MAETPFVENIVRREKIILYLCIYFVYVFTDLKTFQRLLTVTYFVWGIDHNVTKCLTFCEGRYFWEIKQTTRS